jgi:broad specificity phosphatase PhoE
VKLLLVRHAVPVDDARGRCYGRLDLGLSPEGEAQAAELVRSLQAVQLGAVVSSPARRAVATALPLAERRGLEVKILDGLGELDFGELEGKTYDEIAATRPELYAQWMAEPTSVQFPGGESYDDLRRRAEGAVADLREAYAGQCVAVVTHGGVVRAVVAGVLDVPPGRIFRVGVDYASVTVVEWIADEPIVQTLNRRADGPGAVPRRA